MCVEAALLVLSGERPECPLSHAPKQNIRKGESSHSDKEIPALQASPLGDCYYLALKPLLPLQHSQLLYSDQQKKKGAVLCSLHRRSLSQLEALNSHPAQKTDLTKYIYLFQLALASSCGAGLP